MENTLSLWQPAFRVAAVTAEDTYLAALSHLSGALLCLGYVDQAQRRRDEALTEARQLTAYNRAFGLFLAWHRYWAIYGVKSGQAMLRSADEILAIASEHGFPLFIGFGSVMRGWCLGAAGQAEGSVSLGTQGVAVSRATGCNLVVPFLLVTLAETCGMAARPNEGLDRLAEALDLIETTRECWVEAEIHRLRGTLLLSMNKQAAAGESYCRALAVAQSQSARFWELRAATSLAHLWRDQGRRTEARDLLAPIYGWFTEGFETPVLKRARALLDELAA
jgi:predicted ATPase